MKRYATRCLPLLCTLLCLLASVSMGQPVGKKAMLAPASARMQLNAGTLQLPSIPGTSIASRAASVVRNSGPETPYASRPISDRGGNRPAEVGPYGVNGIARFPGDDSSYIAMPDNGTFYNGNDYAGSIEMWINPSRPTLWPPAELISKGANDAQEFLFGIVGERLYFRIDSTDVYASGDTIPVDTWTHVAVTWTGGGPYLIKFYMNGFQEGPVDTLKATWYQNLDTLVIGGASNRTWAQESFAGSIDEVRIWDPELPQSSIIQNRFLSLGDGPLANADYALTGWGLAAYAGLLDSWTFNGPSPAYDNFGGNDAFTEGGAYTYPQQLAGDPIPYNFALYLPGNDSAYVRIPSSPNFDQTGDGSIEMWIKPKTVYNTPVLISKGSSSTVSFAWGLQGWDSTQFFRIGNTVYIDTMKVPMNVWSHVAVTWRNGSNYIVTFYRNGRQGRCDTSMATWDINTDPVIIGGDTVPGWTFEAYSGYLDEVRFWQRELTQTDIQNHMFVSGRALTSDPDLYGFWNFDGNLLNLGHAGNADGSFYNGRPNNARLSANRNESSMGPPGGYYGSQSTVINWIYSGGSGIWPSQFQIAAPFAPIHDNDTVNAAVSQIVVTNPTGTVGNVTAFLAIDHTFINDVVARLTAPNGQSRYLLHNTGNGNENALTFFDDSFWDDPSSTTYLAPWGFIKPIDPLGNFGGSPVQGTWTLKVFDDFVIDSGMVKGWGLRFYNTVVGIRDDKGVLPVKFDLAQNYPNPFNPSTTIAFSIPRETSVRLVVYNVLGQEAATLVNETMKPGNHAIAFDAARFASGTYFYRLTAGNYTATRKMLFLK